MVSNALRRRFLEYFHSHGHTIVPSSPVVPHEDPTLLFTNAGMNQFKDVFLGKAARSYSRAASSQKCIRAGGKHNDLENVGHTSRHMTLFEMLGNFSFGDYFKKEAIAFAWEVATKVFQFDPQRIWATVHLSDDEAFEMWTAYLPRERIVRLGDKDNFWAMGDTGPCGPCSELLYDRGSDYGSALSPLEDLTGERFLEFWNLVFMQFNRSSDGTMTPLAKQSIDTGAGLERVAMLKMGVNTVFETDILRSIISHVEELCGKKYIASSEIAPSFHVIADHLRTLSFAIADGATPSNTDRGYVLRKILRRASRYGRKLGLVDPFLAKLVPTLIQLMGEDYPELGKAKERICEILTVEEESFKETLRRGGNILRDVLQRSIDSFSKVMSGDDAFKLKDTYGFPIEEILLLAKDSGVEVDIATFEELSYKAKELSKKAHVSHSQTVEKSLFEPFLEKHKECLFNGYERFSAEGSIIGFIKAGTFAEHFSEGEEGIILLDRTPFYPEKGGQIGDSGFISHERAEFAVLDTTSPYPGIIAHHGRCTRGAFILGEPVVAEVNGTRRVNIMRNHTATHLIHAALHSLLGEHIQQAGSYVGPDRLRFDFHHHKALSDAEILQIEMMVNEKIFEDSSVCTEEKSFEEVRGNQKIKQFFGDKYGDRVRVVSIGDFSQELCGGTHVRMLSQIGIVKIMKESSVAKGVRRIEAVTGPGALQEYHTLERLLQSIATTCGTHSHLLAEKIEGILSEKNRIETELKGIKKEQLRHEAERMVEQARNGIIHGIVHLSADDAQQLLQKISSFPFTAIILGIESAPDACALLIRLSEALVQKGFSAQELIKKASHHIQGGGGGRKESAQAGGKLPSGLSAAIEEIKGILQDS